MTAIMIAWQERGIIKVWVVEWTKFTKISFKINDLCAIPLGRRDM
jgi:hypothetical protein